MNRSLRFYCHQINNILIPKQFIYERTIHVMYVLLMAYSYADRELIY